MWLKLTNTTGRAIRVNFDRITHYVSIGDNQGTRLFHDTGTFEVSERAADIDYIIDVKERGDR